MKILDKIIRKIKYGKSPKYETPKNWYEYCSLIEKLKEERKNILWKQL